MLIGLGGFDPALGTATHTLGGEDVEAMLRVLLSDWQVIHEPAAIVRHAHPREFAQFERRVWGYGRRPHRLPHKVLIQHPRLLPELIRKLPGGLVYALSPSSEKNEDKPGDYPARLTRLELRGIAYGPLAYARSRRQQRKLRRTRRKAPVELPPAPLRALIVTDSYWPLIGGANRSIELLAHNLTRSGHTVAIATAWQEGVPAVEDQGEVRVHRLRDLTSRMRWISEDPYKHNPPPFPDPEAVLRLRRLIKEFEPDIVHAYGWLTHSTAAALLGKKVPLLISARGYGNICAVHNLARNESICEGPAPLKCLACSGSHLRRREGDRGGSGRVRLRPGAAPQDDRDPQRQPLRRREDGPLPARRRAPATWSSPTSTRTSPARPVDEDILARLPEEPFILYVGAFRRDQGNRGAVRRLRQARRPAAAGPRRDARARHPGRVPRWRRRCSKTSPTRP